MKTKKVVFFFPSFSSIEATAPLGILGLATPLIRAGYQVRIIDATITPDFGERVIEEVSDSLCLAVSLMTGPMIRETAAVAREVKKQHPETPIILGGWHPTLLPEQTLAAEYVDVIVKGQGEDALLEILQYIESGVELKGIPGIGYKDHGTRVLTPDRVLKNICQMPSKSYQLADFDAYEKLCGCRWAMYISSFACPYSCAYCTSNSVYGRNWNALESDQVIEEVSDLVRRYALQLVWIVDDNFLVDKERAIRIAEGFIRAGVEFDWRIQSSVNLVYRFQTSELKILHRAGLSQISHGLDSASQKVLNLMNKGFQKPEMTYSVAERCLEAGIKPSFNLIFGFPGEGGEERQETIRFITDLYRRSPGVEFWTNIFTPYPGSPVIGKAGELGLDLPKSFEEWADFFPRYTVLPWLKGGEHRRVQIMREFLRMAFSRSGIAVDHRTSLEKLIDQAISLPARWRLDHDFYALPLEIWLRKVLGAYGKSGIAVKELPDRSKDILIESKQNQNCLDTVNE